MTTLHAKVISPADYLPGDDENTLKVDPKLRESLHCVFVSALKDFAEKEGWLLRMVHESAPNSGFPEVSLIPPGQDDEHVLWGFRVDAGIPDELQGEDIKRDYVDRIIKVALLKQRAFAGPVDYRMPSILASYPFATFTNDKGNSYDPVEWAEVSMKFIKLVWEEQSIMSLLEKS